jgi:hypothetical protein
VTGVGALIAALLIGTWIVLAFRPPEVQSAWSADGRVGVEGEASAESGPLSVVRRDDLAGAFAAGIGAVYEISLGGEPLPRGFDVSIRYDADELGDFAPNSLSLFVYDRGEGTWTLVPSVVDPAARSVSAGSVAGDAVWWTIGAR